MTKRKTAPHLDSDAKLIDACLRGDEDAWGTLIERYSRLIYTVPLRFGFPKAVADEVFQETCLILLENLGSLRDRERLSAWLVTVSRRVCIQRWRRSQILETVDLLEIDGLVSDISEERLEQLEEQHRVQQAIETLPMRCQRLIKALFFESPQPSYETIANTLGVPVGSVGPTRARCLERLRQALEQLEVRESVV